MKLDDDLYLVGSGGVGISHVSDSHVYLIDGHKEIGLIDTGCGFAGERILENIRREGFELPKLKVIVVTHSHWDHARGVAFIKRQTACRVGVHPAGVNTLEKELWRSRPVTEAGFTSDPTNVDFTFSDDQLIKIGDYQLKVLFTPGHSEDGVCFLVEMRGRRFAFTGDTLSGEGKLGITHAGTDFLTYRGSLEKLLKCKPDALLPGHGLFSLRHGYLYVANAVEALKQRWHGFLTGTPAFYPSWWLTNHKELMLE
jgi:glyoxylase-like metal-dependent hydrolase (beta-lactamase superfamily II)